MRPAAAATALTVCLLAIGLAGRPHSAHADADRALRASIANLHELVDLVRDDVHLHSAGPLTQERRQTVGRVVREGTQRRLPLHLVNLEGQPHFDPIWTHYVVEGRRRASPSTRQYHVRSCPICNITLRELGIGTGAALPSLVVPFVTVQIGDAYFKVDAESGRIYRIVDPIKGTPSFVSTGRLVLSDGRWWVINGTQRTGPIRTRDSTRLPWNVNARAREAARAEPAMPAGRQQPAVRSQPPARFQPSPPAQPRPSTPLPMRTQSPPPAQPPTRTQSPGAALPPSWTRLPGLSRHPAGGNGSATAQPSSQPRPSATTQPSAAAEPPAGAEQSSAAARLSRQHALPFYSSSATKPAARPTAPTQPSPPRAAAPSRSASPSAAPPSPPMPRAAPPGFAPPRRAATSDRVIPRGELVPEDDAGESEPAHKPFWQ